MTVWVLVFYIAGFNAGGPAVIDNITTQAECERVRVLLPGMQFESTTSRTRCIEVRKTK
jgi:hypothetical protein